MEYTAVPYNKTNSDLYFIYKLIVGNMAREVIYSQVTFTYRCQQYIIACQFIHIDALLKSHVIGTLTNNF